MMRCARRRVTWPVSASVRTTSPGSSAAPKTLRKRFRDELDRGVAEANATISGSLFGAAKGGNVTAQIFWLKTRAHWREHMAADDPVPNADAEPNSEVVLVLPDNSRAPELPQGFKAPQRNTTAR